MIVKAHHPFLLRWLRGLFWFVQINSWNMWKFQWHMSRRKTDPQHCRLIGRFKRKPGTITKRWGVYLWGLEIGDRGGTRECTRHTLRLDPCPHVDTIKRTGVGCGTCGAKP
jgi:hypothetical protein